MTEPAASPLAGANVRTLTQRLCEVEAVMAVVGQLSATLRAEVTSRAIARWAEDGAAPTYRVPGFGTISLGVPQQKVVVGDPAEFTSWVAQRYPDEATAHVTIAVPPALLEELLERIRADVEEVGGELSAAVAARPAFTSRLLERDVVVADSGDSRAVIDKGTGEVVAGVTVIPGADPDNPEAPRPKSISVRLDAQAKADAEAQAQARLVTMLEAGLAPALAAEVAPPPVIDVDPPMPDMPALAEPHLEADGEPEEHDVCACSHLRVVHRGKVHRGGCPECSCSKFRVPAVAW